MGLCSEDLAWPHQYKLSSMEHVLQQHARPGGLGPPLLLTPLPGLHLQPRLVRQGCPEASDATGASLSAYVDGSLQACPALYLCTIAPPEMVPLTCVEAKAPGIFGVPLRQSIVYANVAISLVDDNGKSYIYGYVPIVVAKCGVFLKEKGTYT
jgi:hypothetical protein